MACLVADPFGISNCIRTDSPYHVGVALFFCDASLFGEFLFSVSSIGGEIDLVKVS